MFPPAGKSVARVTHIRFCDSSLVEFCCSCCFCSSCFSSSCFCSYCFQGIRPWKKEVRYRARARVGFLSRFFAIKAGIGNATKQVRCFPNRDVTLMFNKCLCVYGEKSEKVIQVQGKKTFSQNLHYFEADVFSEILWILCFPCWSP